MQNKISLDKLNIGDKAKLISFEDKNLPAKFFELGFIPGALIEVKHKAPFKGPICVNILQDNTQIAIRITEAVTILTHKQ